MARVLIIDDSSFQRRILRERVEELGYEVEEAADGDEGLAALRSGRPVGMVLTDILMPRLTGRELLARIREEGIEVPVAVVTADIQETTEKECMNLGAVGFVHKPVKGSSLDTLRALLAAYLPPARP